VQLGFSSMNTPTDIAPDVLARELEARGYESLWMGEHSHIPASRRTPYPAGGEMPAPYKSMMDPYLSLLLAARASEHLLVGTGVALPLEHDLFALAKPLQQPHPPVLCGTGGRVGTREAVAWADGWMPMDIALGDVGRKVARFREIASDAGRDPGAIPITMVTFGDPDLATLARYRELGVDRVVLGSARTGWDDPVTTLPCLDTYAAMMPELA